MHRATSFSSTMCLWVMVSFSCSQVASTLPVASSPPPAGVLGADDVFEIRVYGEPELSATYRVSPDGSIDFPLVGRLVVAERTADQLSERISLRLKQFVIDPHVSVYVKEYNSQKIYVFGQVQKPGTFKYEQGMNIVQAITLAGGFGRLADQNGTFVTRNIDGQEQRIQVSVKEIGRGSQPNLELEPGDIVYVPEALF